MDKSEKDTSFQTGRSVTYNIECPAYNIECPVCFEKGEQFLLSCFHQMHLECASKLISLNCPVCNKEIENLPDDIREKIQDNEKEYQNDLEEEDRHAIDESIRRRNEMISQMEMAINPPPQVEMLAAMQYLRSIGIPMNCIPQRINISVPDGQTTPPPGTWWQVTVGNAIERARQLSRLGSSENTDDESSDDSSGESSSSEDPFEEENTALESIPRSILYRRNPP